MMGGVSTKRERVEAAEILRAVAERVEVGELDASQREVAFLEGAAAALAES